MCVKAIPHQVIILPRVVMFESQVNASVAPPAPQFKYARREKSEQNARETYGTPLGKILEKIRGA